MSFFFVPFEAGEFAVPVVAVVLGALGVIVEVEGVLGDFGAALEPVGGWGEGEIFDVEAVGFSGEDFLEG